MPCLRVVIVEGSVSELILVPQPSSLVDQRKTSLGFPQYFVYPRYFPRFLPDYLFHFRHFHRHLINTYEDIRAKIKQK